MTRSLPRHRTSRIEYRTSGPQRAGGAMYALLYDLLVRHRYYNAAHDRCFDLRVQPTPESASTIADLGLVFQNRPDGFSLFYNIKRLDSLKQWLAGQTVSGSGEGFGCWARLTFQLTATNMDFVGISDLPIDTSPYLVNFFFSNQMAHGVSSADLLATLCPGDRVQVSDFLPVFGSSLSVTVPVGTEAVIVRDIAGASVYRQPVDSPKTTITLDISSLPFDSYSLWAVAGRAEQSAVPPRIVYNQNVPQPLGLVDILFSPPLRDSPGIYPLSVWDMDAPVTGCSYRLPFDARSTLWQYYVVNAAGEGRLENLSVAGNGVDFAPWPGPVALPTGQPAQRFDAGSPLALRCIPPQRFRLTGIRVRADGSRQSIKVDVLPTAPATPVWPGDPDGACVSQIYVYV